MFGNSDESLGANIDIRVSAELGVANPDFLASILPVHVQLRSDLFETQRILEFTTPHRTLLRGMVLHVDRVRYLKAFRLQYAEADYVSKGVMTDVEYIRGTPIVRRYNYYSA